MLDKLLKAKKECWESIYLRQKELNEYRFQGKYTFGGNLCGAQVKGKGEKDPRIDAVTLFHQRQEQAVETVVTEGRCDLSIIKTQERVGTGHVFRVGLPGRVKMKARIWGAGKTQRTETKGRRRNEKELTLHNWTT